MNKMDNQQSLKIYTDEQVKKLVARSATNKDIDSIQRLCQLYFFPKASIKQYIEKGLCFTIGDIGNCIGVIFINTRKDSVMTMARYYQYIIY